MQCKSHNVRKTEIINFRVSKEEKEKIKNEAEELNMSMAEYLVYLSNHKEIKVLPYGEELAKELYQINQHFNKFSQHKYISIQDLRDVVNQGINTIHQIMKGK
ncbi:MAG: plasmid mobilization protein [Proteocatella sp.]